MSTTITGQVVVGYEPVMVTVTLDEAESAAREYKTAIEELTKKEGE